MMAVQMIRRNVQDHADARVKLFDGFKLEAAHFGNRNAVIGHLLCKIGIRRTDVSDHENLFKIKLHDLTGKRRCRRLSVRSGNGNQFAFRETVGKFNLAPDRHIGLIKS